MAHYASKWIIREEDQRPDLSAEKLFSACVMSQVWRRVNYSHLLRSVGRSMRSACVAESCRVGCGS
jgi:hypothetical protein